MPSMVSIRKRLASTLNVVALGLLLLLPTSPHAAEVVLCLEESGDVNVERAEAGECTDKIREKEGGKVKVVGASEQEHCIDCSDVPLRVSEGDDPCGTAILSPSTSLEDPGEHLSLVSTSLQSRPVESGESSSSSPPRFRRYSNEPGQDTSLSSVVLLI